MDLRLAQLDVDEGNLAEGERRLVAVMDEALSSGYDEPAIEAMSYAGDAALLRGDVASARSYFERALTHIDDTGFTSSKTDIAIKLADLYLDENDVAAAEPLLGYVVEDDDTASALKLRARYAFMSGNRARAVQLMEAARDLAGEAWTSDDDADLATYRAAPP